MEASLEFKKKDKYADLTIFFKSDVVNIDIDLEIADYGGSMELNRNEVKELRNRLTLWLEG